jgi:MoxR-like ATPase
MFLNKVRASVAQFSAAEEFARVMALAMASGKNVIFFGPAGHGKSEMTKAVLGAVDPFVLSFGEGMTEDKIYGGIDFAAMNRKDKPVLQYNAENSFLAKEFAVFEELFDAPSNVLLSLKDTLTAKELRAGGQRVPAKTKLVVALTNKRPNEMADLGPSVQALIERFPIQFEVRWSSYDAMAYADLFATCEGGDPVSQSEVADARDARQAVNVPPEVLNSYMHLLEAAATNGRPPSPRIAKAGLEVVKANAAISGRGEVSMDDLVVLKYLGIDISNFMEEISKRVRRDRILSQLAELTTEISTVKADLGMSVTPIKALKAAKKCASIAEKARGVAVTDDLVKRRDAVIKSAEDAHASAIRAAQEATV